MISRNKLRLHKKRRIRAKIKGTDKKPRLAVFKSLKNLSVQVIDDEKGTTLASSSTQGLKVKNDVAGAKKVGEDLAKKCLDKKITEIVFDRAGYKYHGKIESLAESARKKGLKF